MTRAHGFSTEFATLYSQIRVYYVWKLRRSKMSAHSNLSSKDMRNTVELVADYLRPREHTIPFCTKKHFAVSHTPYCAQKPPQNDGSSPLSASTLRDTFMGSAASLGFVKDCSQHRENAARKSCALATAAKCALHLKRDVLPLFAEDKMATYKHLRFV